MRQQCRSTSVVSVERGKGFYIFESLPSRQNVPRVGRVCQTSASCSPSVAGAVVRSTQLVRSAVYSGTWSG